MMLKAKLKSGCLAIAGLSVLALAAQAQTDGGGTTTGNPYVPPAGSNYTADSGKKGDAPTTGADLFGMAIQLADFGLDNSDALSLVVAAKLVAAAKPQPGDGSVRESSDAPALEELVPTTPAEMLAAARAIAGDDATLIAAIDQAEASLGAGGAVYSAQDSAQFSSVTGAGTYDFYVDGYQTAVIDESFYGGEYAEVTAYGFEYAADVDLYVYDENGNLICTSATYGNAEGCGWYPNWTGAFSIVVSNNGAAGTWVTLATN